MNHARSLATSLAAALVVVSAGACSVTGLSDDGSATAELAVKKKPSPAPAGTVMPAI